MARSAAWAGSTWSEPHLDRCVGLKMEFLAPAEDARVNAARSAYHFSSLIMGIVKSTPFQMRTKSS